MPWSGQPGARSDGTVRHESPPSSNSSPQTLPDTSSKPPMGTEDSPIFKALKTPETLVSTFLLTSAALLSIRFYKRNLRRVPTTHYLRPSHFPPQDLSSPPADSQGLPGPSLFGKVTSIGDPDNFRFYHTPGGRLLLWSILRPIPSTRQALKNQTIHIRLAGIDAPELGHFGKEAQPYGIESLEYLKSVLENRYVRVYPLRRDQYDRVVALAFISRGWLKGLADRWWEEWPWVWRKDVGLDVIRAGMATVYEAKFGSVFGGKQRELRYIEAQKQAKEHKKGMWSGKQSKHDLSSQAHSPGLWSKVLAWFGWKRAQHQSQPIETPREYKVRHQKLEKDKLEAEKAERLHGK